MSFAERPIDPDIRCFMYCGDDRCTCGAAREAAAIIANFKGKLMNTCLSAYTGLHPEGGGFVGFVNLSRRDDGSVVFTVRSEGVDPVHTHYAIPADEAKKLLREALEAL